MAVYITHKPRAQWRIQIGRLNDDLQPYNLRLAVLLCSGFYYFHSLLLLLIQAQIMHYLAEKHLTMSGLLEDHTGFLKSMSVLLLKGMVKAIQPNLVTTK